jgi:WD40 repeat protein
MRPHVDAIMSIALNPANEFIFATNARKDNFTYIWDCRKYNTQSSSLFLSEFIIPKCNNQRISLSFDNDGKILYSGS